MEYRKRFAHSSGATLPECRATTLVERSDGALVCAWYAQAYENPGETAIYGSVLASPDSEWNEPALIVRTPGFSEINPFLFERPKGRLWLFYTTLFADRPDTGQVKYVHSHDGGQSWEPPFLLCCEWGRMTCVGPLQLPDGGILLPLYEAPETLLMLCSQDGGRQWTPVCSMPIADLSLQTLTSDPDGTLRMNFLDGSDGTNLQSHSKDCGRNWSVPAHAVPPSAIAPLCLSPLNSGRLALAFQDSSQEHAPLILALSEDNGVTWPYRHTVENEAGETESPALIQSQNGLLHLTYTYQQNQVRHIACDEEWLLHHARTS